MMESASVDSLKLSGVRTLVGQAIAKQCYLTLPISWDFIVTMVKVLFSAGEDYLLEIRIYMLRLHITKGEIVSQPKTAIIISAEIRRPKQISLLDLMGNFSQLSKLKFGNYKLKRSNPKR
jgi:hypothetical protein